MNRDVNALASGCVVFLVVTVLTSLLDGDGGRLDALTIGGVTGGAIALAVWLAAWRTGTPGDTTGY